MKLMRSKTLRAGLVVSATLAVALLGACESPVVAMNTTGISDEKIGDICAGDLSYDVTGPYYANCKNYLRAHSGPQLSAIEGRPEPAEHRACQEIGLTKGSDEYGNCVQELNLLDVSAAHL